MQKSLLYAIAILFLFNACKMKKADLIIHNAKIYTVDEQFNIANAVAIKNGRIAAVGTYDEIVTKFEAESVIDAGGKTLYPGFKDAHCHFWGYAEGLNNIDLNGTKSFDEMLDLVALKIESSPSEWISGWGWDQNDWDAKVFPTNQKLDELFPGKAIVLTRVDGHAVLASSEAIKRSGIDITAYPVEMVIRKNGEPTGVFLEGAGDKLKQAVPKPSDDEMKRLLLQAQQYCFEVGLTNVFDAGLDIEQIEFLQEIYSKQEMSIGVDVWVAPLEKNMPIIEQGPHLDSALSISAIKLYADGALGSRGACLLEPYADDSTSGVIVESPDFYRKWCAIAYNNSLQVATHCIGDSANRMILDIYGEFLKGKNNRRWRIEHAQVVNPDDVEKYKKYCVIPSIQPTHATSDMYWADERLGDRVKSAYIYKTLLEQNGWLPSGSDFPVEQINPLFGFYAAVVRKDQAGWPDGGFQTAEALTREQALKAMTIWAAKSNFTDDISGSIEVRKWADLVLLDNDIMEMPESELFKAKALLTVKKGKIVFDNLNGN